MRLPRMRPSSPAATLKPMSSDGRLVITVSTRSATSDTERAAVAPILVSLSIASLRMSNTVT